MQSILLYVTTLVALAVFAVLLAGVWNMGRDAGQAKGQSGSSANLSQKLMRWRVGLQFLAIVVIVVVLWARSH